MSVVEAGRDLVHTLFDLVLPVRCVICRSRVASTKRSVPVCDDHVRALPEVPDAVCRQCSRPLGQSDFVKSADRESSPLIEDHERGRVESGDRAPLCGPCRTRDHVLEFTMAGFTYRDPLRRLIHDWKFGGHSLWGHWLGEQMASVLEDRLRAPRWDYLVPIPLSKSRLDERGFNQAEQLAAVLSRRLRIPVTTQLHKRHATPPQSNLPRDQRLNNLAGTFQTAAETDTLAGTSVLLVDDIYTTGTTLQTAAAVLLESGVAEVGGLVLARSVRRHEPART